MNSKSEVEISAQFIKWSLLCCIIEVKIQYKTHRKLQHKTQLLIELKTKNNILTSKEVTPSSADKTQTWFDRVWAAYPKKTAKNEALKKVFSKLKKLDETLLEEILLEVENWQKSDSWCENGGKYIPYPSTFLNRERWQEQPEAVVMRPAAGTDTRYHGKQKYYADDPESQKWLENARKQGFQGDVWRKFQDFWANCFREKKILVGFQLTKKPNTAKEILICAKAATPQPLAR